MTKLLIGLLSLALVGTGGLVAAVGGFGGVDPAAAVSFTTPAATTTTGETTTEARTTEATTTGVTTEITSAAPGVTGGAVEVSEFDLLALLMQEAGTVVPRERLIDEV